MQREYLEMKLNQEQVQLRKWLKAGIKICYIVNLQRNMDIENN